MTWFIQSAMETKTFQLLFFFQNIVPSILFTLQLLLLQPINISKSLFHLQNISLNHVSSLYFWTNILPPHTNGDKKQARLLFPPSHLTSLNWFQNSAFILTTPSKRHSLRSLETPWFPHPVNMPIPVYLTLLTISAMWSQLSKPSLYPCLCDSVFFWFSIHSSNNSYSVSFWKKIYSAIFTNCFVLQCSFITNSFYSIPVSSSLMGLTATCIGYC